MFGPIVGFFNGLAVDLVTFPWGGSYPFSFLFLLQSGLIGFLGGINFKKWNENSLLTLLIFISIIFSCFYCLIFPELMMWLMLFPVINLLIVFVFGKNVDSLRWLIILNLSVYLCSFGLGTIGSIFLNPIGSPLLFLRVRAFKEIAKLVLFASMFGALRKWIS
ncbi:hypothetical protein [Candidatus Mycoplasma haematohominis]|uniref:hypothetical protein n=1 Tax=Candidatus Mycoplasma haematohominis TaxID=1494318 RepID=UPI001C0A68A5|nr:hypothetical protein [Candidatus Mycoplasma haemohominis]